MNEQELADKFNRELDSCLSGKDIPMADARALHTIRMLARADFSGESRIKESLKASLLERKGRKSIFQRFFSDLLYSRQAALAAAAACVLVAALAGVVNRFYFIKSPVIRKETVLAVFHPANEVKPPKQFNAVEETEAANASAVEKPGTREGGNGFFNLIPMGDIINTREFSKENMEIGIHAEAAFATVKGLTIKSSRGETTQWKAGGGTLELERSQISAETIFERKII